MGDETRHAQEWRPEAVGLQASWCTIDRPEAIRQRRRTPRTRCGRQPRTARTARTEEAARRRVIAHVVLFRPKTGLTAEDREAFVGALEQALTKIDLIQRATIGRRVKLGRLYDQTATDFPFAAILEFASEADL